MEKHVRAAAVSAASVLCVLIAGCGGGGGGTASTGTATPSAPAPTTFNVSSPDTAFRTSTTSVARMAARGASSNLTVTITDNGCAANLSAVNWGNQRIAVHFNDGAGIVVDQTFAPADYSTSVMTTTNASGSRAIGVSSWRAPVANNQANEYHLYRLLEGGGKPADYVQLGEWRSISGVGGADGRVAGYHLVGNPTPAANMPVSGSATYNGTATGRYFNSAVYSLAGTPFTAIATLEANFGSRTVQTNLSQFAYEGSGPNWDITDQSAISGSTFGSTFSASGMTGSIAGQFYGPASAPASEIGAVFEFFTATQGIVGGLVAGR